MTTPTTAPSGDAAPVVSEGGERSIGRRIINLACGLLLLMVVTGWLIEYQMTRRMAESAERIAPSQEVTLVLIANGTLTIFVVIGAFVLFNLDATRRARDERRLREALRTAAAVNDGKTNFLATVSHEIRTPLNAISGMSELLLDTQLDSEQTELARTVRRNAEALASLIGDLLDSSKLEAGQVDLEAAPFDLRELAEGVAEILVVRADIKGVEVVVDLLPEGPWQFIGDRSRLRQVVMNLVGNAIKFTEKGTVTLRVRTEPAHEGRAARVHIRVIDTGIGIAPEAHRRIFEPFVQAEHATARRYGGTGLGLNIARSLLGLMGGTLFLESAPGQGSTFEATVVLPLPDAQPPAPFGPESLAKIETLVITGNEVLRETLVTLLRSVGASVRAVATADEGLAAADRPVRVLVVDESLPDSRGLDFARMWSSQAEARADARIVLLCSLRSMMTGYVGSHGIAACVYKPVKQARLIAALRHAAGLDVGHDLQPTGDRPAPAPASGGVVRARILLVEDHRDNWVLATQILVAAGYEVDLAEDGVKAVELASSFRYDLILMDVDLPRLDGIEATRHIRAHERGTRRPRAVERRSSARAVRRTPIVALTAHAVESVRTEARDAGMDDYSTKPIRKAQLLEICSRWIDARPVLLVADDTPENHVLMANYLRDSGYRIVAVHNGEQAVRAFAHQRISLVLLDIDMPSMNGYEAAGAIRRLRSGNAVPIVAVTGYEGTEERQRCLDAGFTGHLAKPIHRAELLATIGDLLGHSDTRPQARSASGMPASGPMPAAEGKAPTGVAGFPSAREASNSTKRLLALRDFAGLAALGESLAATAATANLNKLVTVSNELVDAARHEDELRSAWWGDQLAPTLREAQRIVEVRQSAGRSAGGAYDALARVATTLLAAPIASVALISDKRMRIIGGAGLPPPFDITRTLPLSHSLGRIIAAHNAPLMVEDARVDPRVRGTPLVISHGLQAYGGVPLTDADGVTFGVFCAIDERPHRWGAKDVAILEELAGIAMGMLEMERLIEKPSGIVTRPVISEPSTEPLLPPAAPLVAVDEDIADLLPAYVASRRADAERLRALFDAGDFEEIRRLGHKMKGSGSGYGLPEVSDAGRALEDAAASSDRDAIRLALADLEGHLSRLHVRATDGRVERIHG